MHTRSPTGTFFMLQRISQRCLAGVLVWLSISLTLSSVPRCDLLLDLLELVISSNTGLGDEPVSCHAVKPSAIDSKAERIKRQCPCSLQVFPLAILSWHSLEPQVHRAERLLAIVQSSYQFSLQTSTHRPATPPPRV